MVTSTRTRDAEATKRKILNSAEKLFAEKGYTGTSIREISRDCGCSGPLILFHFKSKENLITAVKEALIDRCRILIPFDMDEDAGIDACIEVLCKVIFYFHRDNPTALKIANWDCMAGQVDEWPGEEKLHEMAISQIIQAQEQGVIRGDIEPVKLMIMISGAIQIWWEYRDHIQEKHNLEDAEVEDEKYLRQVISLVVRGMTPMGHRKIPSLIELLPF